MLAYAPEERIKPFEMLTHTVFDELRNPDCKLPNGRALPPLFNFTVSLQQIDIRSLTVTQLYVSVVCLLAGGITA
jgi:hypothetical protein